MTKIKKARPKQTFRDVGKMIDNPKNRTELAVGMSHVRASGAILDEFDFLEDARFYDDQLRGKFKDGQRRAQDRFSRVKRAGGELLTPREERSARKAYSRALTEWLRTARLKGKDREMIERHLAKTKAVIKPKKARRI